MNKIGEAIHHTLQTRSSSAVSPLSSERLAEITARLGNSPSEFLARANPDTVAQAAASPEKCLFGRYPSLSELDAAYGRGTGAAWLSAHITRLSTFSGAKNITPAQVADLAQTIMTNYYYLKFTELMLFFHAFKSGRYGRFYGTVDPLVITTALCEFVRERGDMIDDHYKRLEREKREQWARDAKPMPESIRRYIKERQT